MTGILIPFLYGLAGVSFYAGLHHLLVGWRRPVARTHLMFAFLCLMVALLIVAKAYVYRAETAQTLVTMRRWEVACGLLFFSVLPWFIGEYTGVRPRILLAALSGMFIVVFVVNLVLPYGGLFTELPQLARFTLPWGEQVVDLWLHRPSAWYAPTWAGLVLIFLYSFYACIHQYRSGMRRRARTLLLALALFAAAVLINLLVNHGVIRFVHTAELGFFALVVVMGLGMTLELRESERRLQAVLDNVPAAVYIKDLRGRYLLVNREYERMFAVTHATVAGKADSEIFAAERAQDPAASDRRVLESGRPIEFEEAIDRDGVIRTHYSLKFPLLYPDGAPYAICGVSTDITEQKRAQSELRQHRQALAHVARVSILGELSASLAHELNQPLAAILSNAQAGLRMIGRGDSSLQEIREILEDIATDDKRAGAIVNGLRRLAQRQEIQRARIDLDVTLQEVEKLMHSELLSRQVHVEMNLEANCDVLADKAQIQQVVLNLMMNAVEAMEERPAAECRLRLSSSRIGADEVQVAICDSGGGVPENALAKMFDPFWTTKSRGMGLGLGICRSIVESHGGKIRIERNAARGVTAFFTLPALCEAAQAGHEGVVDADRDS